MILFPFFSFIFRFLIFNIFFQNLYYCFLIARHNKVSNFKFLFVNQNNLLFYFSGFLEDFNNWEILISKN
jgi:hypothetical protein